MNMPKYTAEAACYQTNGQCSTRNGQGGGVKGGRQVVPSARFSSGCVEGAGVRVCTACVGELGCYICSGALGGPQAGSFMCFWEGGSN